MTNKELIEELGKLDQEAIVVLWDYTANISFLMEAVEQSPDEDEPTRTLILLS